MSELLFGVLNLFIIPVITCYILIRKKLKNLTKFEVLFYYAVSVVMVFLMVKLFLGICNYLLHIQILVASTKYTLIALVFAIFGPIFTSTFECRYIEKRQNQRKKDNKDENN